MRDCNNECKRIMNILGEESSFIADEHILRIIYEIKDRHIEMNLFILIKKYKSQKV